jgi:AraC-like DNA-binding protein
MAVRTNSQHVSGAPRLGLVGHESRTIAKPDGSKNVSSTEHRIALLLAGDGSGDVGPLRIPAKRALAWFLPMGEIERLELHGHIELWWLTFDWPGFTVDASHERMLRLSCFGKTQQTQRMKYVDMGDASRMVEHFKALQRAAGRFEMAGELEVRSVLFLLIAFFTDLPEEIARSDGHRALQMFRELLDARAFDDVSIEQLAAEVNRSPEHLRILFMERFGVQPHKYRAALRMAKARQLLPERNLSVKEVARLVGYSDPLYFSRVFKARYGMNPSAMIRKSKG